MTEAITAYDPAVDAPAHHHPVYDYDSGPPVNRGKFAIWLFLATEVMFFTGLIGAYLVIRMGTPAWPHPGERLAVDLTAFNTFVLIWSSFCMVKGVEGAQQRDRGKLLKWLGLTVFFGAFFVSVQVFEYFQLLHHGSVPNLDLFWSTFYVMTGFHGTHVAVGVLWLFLLWLGSLRGEMDERRAMRIELAGLYWHFVDLVWVLLFTIVYLM
ncbi:MAG: heme-copper oxidase subunit III [Planctomycetes bacterium]|nr:heme-copper oxidase subunit III [Planctomycetota bacterium]